MPRKPPKDRKQPGEPAEHVRKRKLPKGVGSLAELDRMTRKDRAKHAADSVLAGPPTHNED